MITRLLVTSLAVLLLTSVLGCSKKDDPASPVLNVGSYKLDGKTITCQAKASRSVYSGGVTPFDYMDIYLTTIPEPASGQQSLHLTYYRPTPAAVYQLSTAYLFDKGSLSLTCAFNSTAATATIASDGSFSGTFAAQEDGKSGNPAPYTVITAGSFTNVSPW